VEEVGRFACCGGRDGSAMVMGKELCKTNSMIDDSIGSCIGNV